MFLSDATDELCAPLAGASFVAARPMRSLVPSVRLGAGRTAARRLRPWFATLLVALVSMLGLTAHALAHPHVFVDVNAELIFDETGQIKAVGNVWRFDDAFSAFAVEGLDAESGEERMGCIAGLP